jgi:hypothetical protein
MTGNEMQIPASRSAYPLTAERHQEECWRWFRSDGIDFQPAVAAIQTLGDGWGWLGRATEAFHSQRPRVRFGAISLTGGFLSALASAFGAYLRAHNLPAPNDLARFRAHHRITAAFARRCNATRI